MPQVLTPQTSKHKLVWECSVLLLFCYYMLWPVNFYLAESIYSTYYQTFAPVLVASVLYFRRRCRLLEYRLMLAFLFWFFLTRLMNRNYAMLSEYNFFVDLCMMLPLFLLGTSLSTEERRRFLDWFSALVGGFYFLLGLICLSAFIRRVLYINPITEGSLGMISNEGFQRINILDVNPCSTSYWFLMAFYLMVYQFFACRNKLWRIPILLSALVDVAVISSTYTRSVKLGIALSLALLLAAMLVRRIRRRLVRVPALILCFLAATLLLYEISDLTAVAMSRLSYSLYPQQVMAQTAEPARAEGQAAARFDARPQLLSSSSSVQALDANTPIWVDKVVDPRKWSGNVDKISSNRITVWRSAYEALKIDPTVLWRGKLLKDSMKLSNPFTPHNPPHYHNVPLQVLMTTGIPGCLLVTALMLCALGKALRLLFSRDPRIPLSARTLALPIIGVQFYSMLEIGIYTAADVRALYYYIMSGMLLGFYRDFFSGKTT